MRLFHSNGMGMQSVTIAAMMCLGDLPMAEVSIFADPQNEGKETYKYRDFFVPWCAERGLEVVTVTAGNLHDDAIANLRGAQMPLYTRHNGEDGQINRLCTDEYKIKPVRREIKRRLGVVSGSQVKEAVGVIIGISLDELIRMRESNIKWAQNVYPLIEKRMTRGDCLEYLNRAGLPTPPRSSCIFCPFKSDDAWKKNSAEEMAIAINLDAKIRRRRGMDSDMYLHAARKPLSEIVFDSTPDMFGSECSGHCGI